MGKVSATDAAVTRRYLDKDARLRMLAHVDVRVARRTRTATLTASAVGFFVSRLVRSPPSALAREVSSDVIFG
jgi:hypothetical protein